MRASALVFRLLAGLCLAALLAAGAPGAGAQEDPTTGLVQAIKQFCEDPTRVGETDITVAAQVSAQQTCRMAGPGEVSFTLVSTTDPGVSYNVATSDIGVADFVDVATGDYQLVEDGDGATSTVFTVVADGYVPITVVNYLADVVEPPPPTEGFAEMQAIKYVCADAARAGETDFAIGGAAVEPAASITCDAGQGVALTLTATDDPALVYTATTQDTGVATFGDPDFVVAAGTYVLTEDFNGATSHAFVLADGTFNLAAVINWVAPPPEPTPTTAPPTEPTPTTEPSPMPPTPTTAPTTEPTPTTPPTPTTAPTTPPTIAPTPTTGGTTGGTTTLPSAGAGASPAGAAAWLAALVLAALGLGAGAWVLRRRAPR